MSGAERRKHPRVVVELPVRLTVEGTAAPARLHDICRDAALVETHHRCLVGTRVSMAWSSSRGGMVEVAGTVLRVSAAEGDARRVAILFADVAPAAATAIELLLEHAGEAR